MAKLSPPSFRINLCVILSESKRIINAHSRHFLALSVLFLLPVSFSLSAYPFINQLFFQSFATTIKTQLSFNTEIFIFKHLIFTLLYNLFISIFSFLATGSITYSVFHGFYGQSVKLTSAIKSAFTSFFRLFSTCLVIELILFGILLILTLILFSLIKATQFLGFLVNFSSPNYFSTLCLVFLFLFNSIVIYMQVNWIFANVVVVVESSWGIEPLKRSKNLVKGQKWVAFSIFLFYGFLSMILTWASLKRWNDATKSKGWAFFIHIVITSIFFTLLLLSNLAATTVFYVYSKAELIAGEFETEYVSLPFEDGKVAHIVSDVYV